MHELPARPLGRRHPEPNPLRFPELLRLHPDQQPLRRHCPGCGSIYPLNPDHWYVDQSRRPWADRYYLPFCKQCRIAAQAYRRLDPETAAAERERASLSRQAKRKHLKVIRRTGQSQAEHATRAAQELQQFRELKERENRYALVQREHLRMAGGYQECRDWVKLKIRRDSEAAMRKRLEPGGPRPANTEPNLISHGNDWAAALQILRTRHRLGTHE